MREIGHFIGGTEVKGASGRFGDVFDPNTGEVQARVAFAKRSEAEHAIAVAEAAQPAWATVNPQRRARVLMKFLELAQREFDSLARLHLADERSALAGVAKRFSSSVDDHLQIVVDGARGGKRKVERNLLRLVAGIVPACLDTVFSACRGRA